MLGALTGLKKNKEPVNQLAVPPRNDVAVPPSSDVKALREDNGLHEAQPVYKGDPDSQVIVFDLDETLIAGDKKPFTKQFEDKVNAMGDRQVRTISKSDPANKLDFDIKYVLRPGVEELLAYLTNKGYKLIASTRNYGAYAEAIKSTDPVLSKYLSGTLGREDLLKPENKDFKKYPNHPDRLGFVGRTKAILNKIFVAGPQFLWNKFKSIFNGKNVRWSPGRGTLGKYPPNMIELLKLNGNHSLDNLKAPRYLVDNKAERELEDSKHSGDFAVINPNVDRNGDGKPEDFQADSTTPKVKLKDPETGKEEEGYQWVKNVIDGIEKGWQQQFKDTTGKEPKKLAT
jgi:hypothetical protein